MEMIELKGLAKSSITPELMGWVWAARKEAYEAFLAELPARKLAAKAAYDNQLARGGSNAQRRAVRAARRIWSSFTAS